MVLVPLGHGSSTNADFAGTIARREVLLRYTNRYYLPEYAAYLEPTLENVTKMEKQKADCMNKLDEMAAALDAGEAAFTRGPGGGGGDATAIGSGTSRCAIRRWM